MIRLEAIVLTLIVLAPLVAITLPAPPTVGLLPAPRCEMKQNPPTINAESATRRIAALDDQLRVTFTKTLKMALSSRKVPMPLF